jgi:hypothetical protein
MTTTLTPSAGPDLSGFLMAHRGFRAEFGRLAVAARQVRDAKHEALVESQIDLVMHVLHHHHTAEDVSIWPSLVRRAPTSKPALDRLEAQHEAMDLLFIAVTDTGRSVADRADDLQLLHDLVNDHLDEEERVAVPLIQRHVSAAEWEKDGEEVSSSIDRRRLPLIFGWLASTSTPGQRAEALRTVPAVPRTLFRVAWWPAYRRRFRALYGELEMGPDPTRVLS